MQALTSLVFYHIKIYDKEQFPLKRLSIAEVLHEMNRRSTSGMWYQDYEYFWQYLTTLERERDFNNACKVLIEGGELACFMKLLVKLKRRAVIKMERWLVNQSSGQEFLLFSVHT
jgi:hypothetical protein